jgi:hypothetical protein
VRGLLGLLGQIIRDIRINCTNAQNSYQHRNHGRRSRSVTRTSDSQHRLPAARVGRGLEGRSGCWVAGFIRVSARKNKVRANTPNSHQHRNHGRRSRSVTRTSDSQHRLPADRVGRGLEGRSGCWVAGFIRVSARKNKVRANSQNSHQHRNHGRRSRSLTRTSDSQHRLPADRVGRGLEGRSGCWVAGFIRVSARTKRELQALQRNGTTAK